MAPVKLYGSAMSTCTGRVLITLEEKGAEYELVPINFATAEHKQPAHLQRNPFGQVPAFEDGDLVLIESRAISKYVARKHKGSGPDLLGYHSEKDAALVEVWMEVESQQYNPSIAPLIFQLIFVPMFGLGQTDAKVVESEVAKLGKVLDVYEARLSQSKYLAGDFCSLADLHHVTYTFLLMSTKHANLINDRPHVKAWWEDLISRPSVKKVTQGMIPSGN